MVQSRHAQIHKRHGSPVTALVVNAADLAIKIDRAAHAAAFQKAIRTKYIELARPDDWYGKIKNAFGVPKDGFYSLDIDQRTMQSETAMQKRILAGRAHDAIRQGVAAYTKFQSEIGNILSDQQIVAKNARFVDRLNHIEDDARRQEMHLASEIELYAGLASKTCLFVSGFFVPGLAAVFSFAVDTARTVLVPEGGGADAIVTDNLSHVSDAGEYVAEKYHDKAEKLVEQVADLRADRAEILGTMQAIKAELSRQFPAVAGTGSFTRQASLAKSSMRGSPFAQDMVDGLVENMNRQQGEIGAASHEIAAREGELSKLGSVGKLATIKTGFTILNIGLFLKDIEKIRSTYRDEQEELAR